MDYAPAECITEALAEAVRAGALGYPRFESGGPLGEAYAGFARRHFGQRIEPDHVRPVVDVTAGVRLLLDVLSGPGAMVMPVPAYSPQLAIAEISGRKRVDLLVDADAPRAELDLDELDRLFADGAQTLLLTQPHNPWGRVFTRAELEGVRDVVVRHGARVISDEIHAPLVLPGATYVSYLDLDGTADHAVAVVAASKAFNTAGLKCAQLVVPDDATRARLEEVPMARNDSWSSLGVVASIAAYTDGDPWLAALIERLDAQRRLLGELLAAAPARGPDAPARGDVPRLDRPARLRPREARRRRARSWPGVGVGGRGLPPRPARARPAQHRDVARAARPRPYVAWRPRCVVAGRLETR